MPYEIRQQDGKFCVFNSATGENVASGLTRRQARAHIGRLTESVAPESVRYERLVEADKYSAEDRRDMAKSGAAMEGGSYPIKDKDDLQNAIHAVGRGGANHDAIRRHIIARAKALGASDMIPDNWSGGGDLKESANRFHNEGIQWDQITPHGPLAESNYNTSDQPQNLSNQTWQPRAPHFDDGTGPSAEGSENTANAPRDVSGQTWQPRNPNTDSANPANSGDGYSTPPPDRSADTIQLQGRDAGTGTTDTPNSPSYSTANAPQDNTGQRWQPPSGPRQNGDPATGPGTARGDTPPSNIALASEDQWTGTADSLGHVDAGARSISNAGTATDPANTEGGGAGPGTGMPWLAAGRAGQSVREAFPGSWQEITKRVTDALNAQESTEATYELPEYIHPVALYTDRVVYCDDGKMWEAGYTIDDAGSVALGPEREVIATFAPIGNASDVTESQADCCTCCDDDECDDDCDSSCCDSDNLTEAPRLVEATGSEGREWDVVLIRSGLSGNGRFYPAKALRESVHLFENVPCFADHPTEQERNARPERSIRDKVGVFSSPVYESLSGAGTEEVGQIRARLTVVAPWLRETLIEAVAANRPDFIGFSINGGGLVKQQRVGSRFVGFVESISSIHSVDAVTTPAAGGRIERLVASDPGSGGMDMTPEELNALVDARVQAAIASPNGTTQAAPTLSVNRAQLVEAGPDSQALAEVQRELRQFRAEQTLAEALTGVKVNDIAKQQIKNRVLQLAERRTVDVEDITAMIRESQDMEAAVLRHYGIGDVTGLGATRDGVHARGMVASHDNYYKALEGMFAGEPIDDVTPFRSLREAYGRWNGLESWEIDPYAMHREMTQGGYDSHLDHKRIQESLSTATWTNVYADVFYLRVLKEYQASPYYDMWRKLCSEIEDVPDFYTRHWDRVGGYADLSTVAEQATYPNMTSPTDQAVSYAVSKHGGIDDITFEAIVGDRIGKIRRIPGAMGRAAARTLWKNVAGLATNTNPTLGYDSVALYNSGHSNTASGALSLSTMASSIQGMRAQTAFGESSEILGPRNLPKYLMVNNTLEQLARRIANPTPGFLVTSTATTDTTFNPDAMAGYNLEVIVYDQLTSTTEWYLVANPMEVDTIIIGFLNGQQQPELFVQDQPNVGSVFTADKVSYKVRHVWGTVVADHRSFYRGNS